MLLLMTSVCNLHLQTEYTLNKGVRLTRHVPWGFVKAKQKLLATALLPAGQKQG